MANACFRFYRSTGAPLLALAGVLAAATTLASGPLAWAQASTLQKQISEHEQKLAEARAAKNQKDEASELLSLGDLHWQAGEMQKALDADNQALGLSRELKSRKLEAAALNGIGKAYSILGQKQKALDYYNQALPICREVGDRSGEAETMSNIGAAYSDLSQNQKALESLNQALPIRREVGDRRGEAETLQDIGGVYFNLGQNQKALEFFNQALPIQREAGDRRGEAETLDDIGAAYFGLGQTKKALEYLNQALPVRREAGDRRGEAATLNDIGAVYSSLGQKQQALEYLNQALPIRREVGDRSGEESTLTNLGVVYESLGEIQKALESYNQALPIQREVGDRSGEAVTLSNLGLVYSDLGQKQRALELYHLALPIQREIGDRSGEAVTLSSIGVIYIGLGQNEKGLEYCNQALPIRREVGDRSGEATTLSNIGAIYERMGQRQKALEYYSQALPIRREVGDRSGEETTLSNIGVVYFYLGQEQKALEYLNQALPIEREVGDRSGEGHTLLTIGTIIGNLGNAGSALRDEMSALSLAKALGDPDLQGGVDGALMKYFRDQKRPEVAILFGMDAVNSFQQMRKNISGLDKDIQTGFAQSKSGTYRELAELLVQTDRLGEAEQVLDLLKEQELKEVVRGAAPNAAARLEPLNLTAAQQKVQGELAVPEKTAAAVTDLSVQYATLLAKPARSPEEEARLKTLDGQIEAGNGEVSAFFKNTVYAELAQKVGTQDANALLSKEKSEVSRLQNTLAELGPRVMGIRLLLGDQHAYAIVVTAHAREKFELKATPAELRSKVLQVRDDLRTPSSDPKPHLAELYAMVAAPMEAELKALERRSENAPGLAAQGTVPTLLWSLDGVLRYLPMAALYDGHRYMVERFRNVLFTPESYGHMTASAGVNANGLRALAMGLSESYGGLPALPGVMPELDAVVHDPAVPASHGPMDGILQPNEQFTLAALKTKLGSGKSFPVVHIASHFVVETGGGKEPYLMLGGEDSGTAEGYALTLSKMEDSTISFHGTELLTLSACSTAKGDAAKDGMEMDSLGMIAQQKDAEAVLATLWDVSDASTSRLMSDFYGRWVKDPADGKAEALRQAQLAFLRGAASQATGGSDRGFNAAREGTAAARQAGYSHPFYWAPFVLIGNYQ